MTSLASRKIEWQGGRATREDRERAQGHRGVTIWLTGRPGSGKSTIARALEEELLKLGVNAYLLDGDHVVRGLNSDLGTSAADRAENLRRVGEVARMLTNFGAMVIAAFVSPCRADREAVRQAIGRRDFVEVFVDCPQEVCEERYPEGYRAARTDGLPDFAGLATPYEIPDEPGLILRSDRQTTEEAVDRVIRHLRSGGYFAPPLLDVYSIRAAGATS